jgi:hypothetical protein
MTSDPSQVISTTVDDTFHSVRARSVYHRNFPEVRGEGSTPEDAAARLAALLARTLDNVSSDWRRVILERAIDDRPFSRTLNLPFLHPLSAADRSVFPQIFGF